jgi:hypothetical protein
MRVVARQAAAAAFPRIPLGAQGSLGGAAFTVIGFMRRSAVVDGERFQWHEYLLYGRGVGFRWLVDDEGTWLFVRGISSAEVAGQGRSVRWHGRAFALRNDNQARVEYVLGEFYWQVEVGETVHATDFVAGADVLSREEADGEVNWSYGSPMAWPTVARAFGVAPSAPGPQTFPTTRSTGSSAIGTAATLVILVLVLCCLWAIDAVDGGGGGGGYSGGGYSGGSGGFGGFGGK